MWSIMKMTLLFALAALLFSGCAARHQVSPDESMKNRVVADGRPCVGNLSVEGGYWSGHTVRSFGEYPKSDKNETLAYLLSKISSIGYIIEPSDREAGLIRASYPLTFGKGETTSLDAVVSPGKTGIRVDLTFRTGGMATFAIDEVQKEFCSILEGVPVMEAPKPVEPRVGQAPAISEKPIVKEKPAVIEKPVVVKKPEPLTVQTLKPPAPKDLVVIKKANLRAKASIRSKVIGRLKKGEKLESLGRSGNWFQVKSASGLTGWVYKTLVKTIEVKTGGGR